MKEKEWKLETRSWYTSIGSKDHDGHNKEYVHLKRAYYAVSELRDADYVDDVTFGFYDPDDGGTSGEMDMYWYNAGDVATPRLECFTGSWHALAQFKDVINVLAQVDGQNITPEQFCAILDRCGFTDKTPRNATNSASTEM